MRAKLRAVRRQPGTGRESGEHRAQVLRGDVAAEAEQSRAGAGPRAWGLARARVVLVEAGRDLGEVVRLDADAQLPEAHHRPPMRRGRRVRDRYEHPGAYVQKSRSDRSMLRRGKA